MTGVKGVTGVIGVLGVLGSSDPATEAARVRWSDASTIRVESLLMWLSSEIISRLGLLAGLGR